ncbi:MAG: hypothetical protein U5K71_01705 [Gracilimonas sp.]|nr:hypothetical protein [Gracilimonas sp.]
MVSKSSCGRHNIPNPVASIKPNVGYSPPWIISLSASPSNTLLDFDNADSTSALIFQDFPQDQIIIYRRHINTQIISQAFYTSFFFIDIIPSDKATVQATPKTPLNSADTLFLFLQYID